MRERRRARRRRATRPRGLDRRASPTTAGVRSPTSTPDRPCPDPGAIYTIGHNYRPAGVAAGADTDRPERPLVYGKLPSSVAASGGVVAWDRALTPNVDAEVELGVVIGEPATDVEVGDAMAHVFGYTVIDDVSSRDPWLDGDQWLLGKSMAGLLPGRAGRRDRRRARPARPRPRAAP